MSLKNQRSFRIKLAGEDTGIWDTKTGAGVDSAEKKYYAGAMAEPVSLGGKRTIDNLVSSRLCDLVRDVSKLKRWESLVGRGPAAEFIGIELFLDPDKNVVGEGRTYSGTLKRVSSPDHDSEADAEEAMVEIEATITKIS
jgi:hypothetical protein